MDTFLSPPTNQKVPEPHKKKSFLKTFFNQLDKKMNVKSIKYVFQSTWQKNECEIDQVILRSAQARKNAKIT